MCLASSFRIFRLKLSSVRSLERKRKDGIREKVVFGE